MFERKKYRIVTNGLNHRIQWLGRTFILRRPKWCWLRQPGHEYILEFSSIESARTAVENSKKEDRARKMGYVPVCYGAWPE